MLSRVTTALPIAVLLVVVLFFTTTDTAHGSATPLQTSCSAVRQGSLVRVGTLSQATVSTHADVVGDGTPYLVYASSPSTVTTVYTVSLANSSQTPSVSPVAIAGPLSGSAKAVAAADLDKDGSHEDVLVAHGTSLSLIPASPGVPAAYAAPIPLSGASLGSFDSSSVFVDIGLVDLDASGWVDVVVIVGDPFALVLVALDAGGSGFAPLESKVSTSVYPSLSIEWGSVGSLELPVPPGHGLVLVPGLGIDVASFLVSDGNGSFAKLDTTFGPTSTLVHTGATLAPISLAALGPVSNSDRDRLVYYRPGLITLYVIPVTGSGYPSVVDSSLYQAHALAVGRVNWDTFADIVIASNSDVFLYVNDGDGGFSQPRLTLTNSLPASGLALALAAPAGTPDMFLTLASPTRSLWHYQFPSGVAFNPVVYLDVPSLTPSPPPSLHLAAFDADVDGSVDLVVASQSVVGFYRALPETSGLDPTLASLGSRAAGAFAVQALASSPFNAASTSSSSRVTVLTPITGGSIYKTSASSTTLAEFLGGLDRLTAMVTVLLPGETDDTLLAITLTPLRHQLVAYSFSSDFIPQKSILYASSTESVTQFVVTNLAQMAGPDLVLATETGMAAMTSNATGFSPPIELPFAFPPGGLLAVDTLDNGDVLVDLIVVDAAGTGNITLIPGKSSAAPFFDAAAAIVLRTTSGAVMDASGASTLRLADVSADSAVDLVAALESASEVALWVSINMTAGHVAPKTVLLSLANPSSLVIRDWNGDGFLDITVSSSNPVNAVGVLTARPALSSSPALTTLSPADLLAAVSFESIIEAVAPSTCLGQHIELLGGSTVTQCFAFPYVIASGTRWVISAPANGPPAVIDCEGSGTLFEVRGTLIMRNVVVRGTRAGLPFSDSQIPEGRVVGTSAVRVSSDGALHLENVHFTGCVTSEISISAFGGFGAGVLVLDRGVVTVTDSTFSANSASIAGGSIAVLGTDAAVTVSGSVLANGTASGLPSQAGGGGAVFVAGSRNSVAFVDGTVLSGNSAPQGSGGSLLVLRGENNFVSFTDSKVVDSTAGAMGGCVAVLGDPDLLYTTSGLVAFYDGSEASGCSAKYGGCLAVSAAVDHRLSDGILTDPLELPEPEFVVSPTSAFDSIVGFRYGTTTELPKMGDCRADYGGLAFACGTVVRLDEFDPVGPWAARVGGGALFTCTASQAVPVDVGSWFRVPGLSSVPDRYTAAYGALIGSLPRAVVPATGAIVPLKIVSGVQLTSVVFNLLDAFGHVVLDPDAVVTLSATNGVLAVGQGTGIAMDATSGLVAGSSVSLRLPGSVSEPWGMLSSVTVSVRSRTGGQPYVWTTNVTGCDVGFGLSLLSSSSGVVCAPCTGEAISTVLSFTPCRTLPTCSPSTSLVPVSNNTIAEQGCMCAAGFYTDNPSAYDPFEPKVACTTCPEGGVCRGRLSAPTAREGFYRVGNNVFAACLRSQSCRAGGVCALGYEGYMCNTCQTKFYTDETGACSACPTGAALGITAAVVMTACIGAAVGVFLGVRTANASRQDDDDGVDAGAGEMTDAKAIGSDAELRARKLPPTLSMIVIASQMVGILGDSNYEWGSGSSRALGTFNVFNYDISLLATECSLGTYHAKYVLSVLLPLLMIGCAAVTLVLLKLTGGLRGLESHSAVALMETVVFSLLPLLYIPISRSTLAMFACTKLPNGDYVVVSDPGVQCFDAAWFQMAPVGVLGVLVFVIGGPVFFFTTVARHRDSLFDPLTFSRYGALYKLFRKPYYWGEVANLGKRLSLVVAAVFFANAPLVQIALTLLVLIASLVVVLQSSPYYHQLYNTVEARITVVLLMILLMGVFSYSDRSNKDDVTQSVVFVGVVTGIVVLGIVCVHALISDVLEIKAERAGTFNAPEARRVRLFRLLEDEIVDLAPGDQAMFETVGLGGPGSLEMDVMGDVGELDLDV